MNNHSPGFLQRNAGMESGHLAFLVVKEVILGLYRDNGTEHGNYYNGV